jgi:ABC-type branched-subunit amino acid transport system ATPase component/ABC-type branched-subunit amino acid transport system permease subunit
MSSRGILANVVGPVATLAVIVGIAGLLGSYAQYVLGMVIVHCLIGAALVMIVGYARVIMLAAGAMLAIGAYGSTISITRAGLPYPLALACAALLGAGAGVLLAVPASRFRGHHLAMATMVFQILVVIGIREWTDVTGGALGLRTPAPSFGSLTITADLSNLALIAGAAVPALLFLAVLLAGSFGKMLRAASASEIACEAFGVDTSRMRVAAFAFSSAVVAYAGALLAPRVRILDPDSFDITRSVIMLGYPIVGGMSSLWGGLIGGALLQLAPELLRPVGRYQEIILAVFVIAVMLALPGGLMGLVGSFAPPPRRRPGVSDARMRLPTSTRPARRTAAGTALALSEIQKSYDAVRAVDGVTLQIESGVMHGLIGPNGAGKTTLFNVVSGFVSPDTGTIELFGKNVEAQPARTRIAHGMTRTFQNVAIFPELSCLDNVVFGLGENSVWQTSRASFAEIFGSLRTRERIHAAAAALGAVGLDAHALAAAGSLSLGNQRRLELARAIVSEPRLILLDEPVAGVSHEEEKELSELLRLLNRERGMTMLIIEHNIAFVRALCDTVSVMAAGRLIAQGKFEAVIGLPVVRHHYFGDPNAARA